MNNLKIKLNGDAYSEEEFLDEFHSLTIEHHLYKGALSVWHEKTLPLSDRMEEEGVALSIILETDDSTGKATYTYDYDASEGLEAAISAALATF